MSRFRTYNILGLKKFLPFSIHSFGDCSEKKDRIKYHSISSDSSRFDSTSVDFDLAKSKNRGSMRINNENVSIGNFIKKSRSLGLRFELIKDFCNKSNQTLDIIFLEDFNTSFQRPLKGEGDIIAHSMTITKERNG